MRGAARAADGLDSARTPEDFAPLEATNPVRLRCVAALCARRDRGRPAAACNGSPTEREANRSGAPSEFSSSLAWAELEELAEEPRQLGSDGAEDARSHIEARLSAAGIAVEKVTTTVEAKGFGPLVLTHLVATLPGASPDRIVLVAPYGSGRDEGFESRGANDGASGAALLIEVARVLELRTLPYTVELVWLEGEGRLGHGTGEERELRWLGSRALAERWEESGHLRGVRLLISFNRVCDVDLHIARDSGSHREYREGFWRAARKLGFGDVFSPISGYESVASSHVAFRERGVRAVVAIEDTAFGGEEAPGVFAGKDDVLEHCAPESLEAVGRVAIEAVDSVGARLAKIDRFARTPSVEPEPKAKPEAAPEKPSDPNATEGADAAGNP